jgi:hypothetical protein
MDLKKYFDCLGENEDMDVGLIRVWEQKRKLIIFISIHFFLELYISNTWCITFLSLSSNNSSWFKVTELNIVL